MGVWEELSSRERNYAEVIFVFGVFVGLAALYAVSILTLLRRLQRHHPWIQLIKRGTVGLGIWAILLIGINQSVRSFDYMREHPNLADAIAKFLSVSWVALASVALIRVFVAWLRFTESRTTEADNQLRDRNELLRKVTTAFVLIVGVLLSLRIVGADISPFLAGGAVGGIVLGLALQESLGNVFAGIFLNADRSIKIGDLVRLDNGKEGFVQMIGWRNTEIRLWDDTLLVIPNSLFAKQSYINMRQPVLVTTVSIDCGVSYQSDLEHVERVAIEVASRVQARYQGVTTELEAPYVRWRVFGDDRILFRTFIPVGDSLLQYRASSDFVKELHARFRDEGIEIPVAFQGVAEAIRTGSRTSSS